MRLAGALVGLCLGCGTPSEPVVPEVEPDVYEPLEAPRLARRASLDLRGVLPSVAELDAVEADPEALDGLVDQWLDDPRLEERVVDLLAERWHTRVDVFDIEWIDYAFEESEEFVFEQAVGEEPLRLMAWVVVQDRPWTEVVTAQHTVANPLLAEIWPLERQDPADPGWVPATYTDGRPMSGVLSSNGLWWRYNTNRSNMNRKRAAVIIDKLLCEDVLGRPVSFSGSETLSAAEGTEDAVRSNPACLSCHSALDPLATTLFGFWWVAQYSVEEETAYHAERELLGPEYLGVEPAWFGTPLGGLADLGPHVAADPRFTRCAAESFAEGLWRREAAVEDRAVIDGLREALVAQELRIKPLLAEIIATDSYRAGQVGGPAAERERPQRMLSVEQLASVTEDLSGFTWTKDGFEQLANDSTGVRVLAGGVDGATVYRPQVEPGLTWALVIKRLAEASATTAVERDLVEEQGLLLDRVSLDTTSGDPAITEQLEALWWRLLAERPDPSEVEALEALWTAVAAEHGTAEAWTAVLTALFRDPSFVSL